MKSVGLGLIIITLVSSAKSIILDFLFVFMLSVIFGCGLFQFGIRPLQGYLNVGFSNHVTIWT